jgi:hypothetical protein
MKSKVLLLAGLLLTGTLVSSHAGGAFGVRWGGCGGSAVGFGWGGGGWGGNRYWGGPRYSYWGPRYYAPRPAYGWGWGQPVIGVSVVTAAPRVVTYVPASRSAYFSGSLVAASQEQLAELGYYNGAIDGVFGPMTGTAVRRFQRDYGLPVTGRLDRNTRATLGI